MVNNKTPTKEKNEDYGLALAISHLTYLIGGYILGLFSAWLIWMVLK